MILVLAEKPSVARDLAQVLGASARREGYLEGNGYRVTWAIGHLVALAQPAEIDPGWKRWSRATLPMLPQTFPLSVLASGRAQYRVVERLLHARDTQSVIAATDAGREGELIFRYIYERARCRKPWQRLWLSSMTEPAIRAAFAKLQPGRRYDGLASAARARSQADWLVGMNFSRAYTLTSGTLYSVGRVQTPTLAMVVARDQAIRDFVPEPYREVEASFETARGRYKGTYYAAPPEGLHDAAGRLRPFQVLRARLPADGVLARAIAERTRRGRARVAAVAREPRRTPPPLLYDLTELQRHAHRLFGYSAQRTLEIAQDLYEKHKLLSYPRTDSRHLSSEVARTLPNIVRAIAGPYAALMADGSGERPLGRRYVDDSKVGDHHALIPTASTARLPEGSPHARIYDLVCRRLLMAWHADLIESVTRVLTEVISTATDVFATSGTTIEVPGWTVLDLHRAAPADKLPPGIAQGDPARVLDVVVHDKQTRPPPAYTDATLLTAMETAGRTLDDKTLIDALRESGLGTPATRAATIETLLERGYLARNGKSLNSTPVGEALIAAAHPLVKSPEMTGRWELRLRRMERGDEAFEPFMREISAYVREVVHLLAQQPEAPRAPRPAGQRFQPRKRGGRAAPRRKRARSGTGGRARKPGPASRRKRSPA